MRLLLQEASQRCGHTWASKTQNTRVYSEDRDQGKTEALWGREGLVKAEASCARHEKEARVFMGGCHELF